MSEECINDLSVALRDQIVESERLKEENGDLKFALQLIMVQGGTAGAIAYQALKELES